MGRNDSQDRSGTDRRSVLRRVGAASLGVSGFAAVSEAATAAAPTPVETGPVVGTGFQEAMAEYGSLRDRRELFRNQAGDLLEELATRDVLPEADTSTLPLETVLDGSTGLPAADEREGVGMTYINPPDGERTALVMVSTVTENHALTLYVQPDADRRYALVQPTDGRDKFAIDPSSDPMRLETSSTCENYTKCGQKCELGCPCPGPTVLYNELHMDCYVPNEMGECECFVENADCGGGDCWESCTFDCCMFCY